ncbi:MAG: hypothetical protein H6821_00345 [Planctomycetaceae bacterium]|nr:hypothetical protein [Planctomycetales bacterium]MCB9872599.1 hypothetical protein [Planctomycetaceae bacterium]MCB9939575.1 hypothetical protein [Planctomycetaceae bacterium]HRX79082.1 hypothetical protein [Pirellulaceae bacterium]
MTNFQPFPWRYIKEVLDSREFFFEQSMAFTKEEIGDDARACPDCGKQADDLTWVPVDTADETWPRGEGRSGFVTCCMECKNQIDFFVDDELTRLEAELRADGTSSQDLPWSETEPVG